MNCCWSAADYLKVGYVLRFKKPFQFFVRNPCSDPKFNDTLAFGARDVDATAANKTKTAREEKKSSFLLKITRLEFALLPLHSFVANRTRNV